MGSKPSSTKKEDIGDHLNLPFLIPKEEFAFHEKLGEGYFGIVTRATWQRSNGSKIPCAVKMIQKWEEKPVEAMGDIRGEISSMQKLKHKNI
uniref:Protein kinase domain-containing protein n=1 Tax=Acrobeloides nanus TaxID=290746 RepID=A0A914DXR9_9BILA